MIFFKYILIAFVLSFLGTLPIGLITLTIAQKTIEKGKSAGWMIALGATVIEFIYTVIALLGLDVLSIESSWKQYIQIGTIFLFFIMSCYYWFKASTLSIKSVQNIQERYFLQGIGIGLMNMLIVPFWLIVGLWLESNGINFKNKYHILWFSVGGALGALLAFIAYIEGSILLMSKSEIITSYANKIIGGLFFLLALVQLIQIIY